MKLNALFLLGLSLIAGCDYRGGTVYEPVEGPEGEQGEPGEKGEPGEPAATGSHIVLVQDEVAVGEYKEVVAICDDGFITGGGCIFSGDLDRNAPHLIQYVNADDEFASVPDGWLCAGTNMGPGAEKRYMGTFAVCSGAGETVATWLPQDTDS